MSMLNDKELLAVKEKLRTGYCNPQWRKHIEDLISEIERLRTLLDSPDSPESGKSSPPGDQNV